jgi:hypothetical protein
MPGLPYGLSTPNDSFDPDTLAYLRGPAKVGLTCATFVLAIFEFGGLKLLQYELWPHRDSDVPWQNYVISELKRTGASQEHIAAVEGQVGAMRIRPEEVAASATFADEERPVAFEATDGRAKQIVAILDAVPNTD